MKDFLSEYCSPEWRDFVIFHSQVIKYKSGEVIFKVGEETKGLFVIQSGKVKITTNTGQAEERIIRLVKEGDVLGHRGFGGDWKYTISAITLEDSELLLIPLNIFNQTVKANAKLGFYMMMFFAEELRESEQLARQLPVRNIVASVLYNNYKVFGFENENSNKLSYTLSRKEMANQAAIRYETTIRILMDFVKEKIIETDGKSIKIIDLDRLKRIKNGEI
jgi:CRP-like cAMP-binding protein